ncbi:hypothetical protein OZH93_24630, partial [Escherichia coli]|uniref:hypothetical protein n=1 Tax=Escherichia coli TaxID=562 RepID=UPI002284A505
MGTVHETDHIVVKEVNPHHISFKASNLFTGHWDVYYKRTRNGVEIKSPVLSLTLTDHVNPPVPTGLEAPILPQVMNGSLDLTVLTEPVIVKI